MTSTENISPAAIWPSICVSRNSAMSSSSIVPSPTHPPNGRRQFRACRYSTWARADLKVEARGDVDQHHRGDRGEHSRSAVALPLQQCSVRISLDFLSVKRYFLSYLR